MYLTEVLSCTVYHGNKERQCLCKICDLSHNKVWGSYNGYDSGPDVKDATHQRRSHGSGPTVALTHQTVVALDFLNHKANKLSILSSVHTLSIWMLNNSCKK